MRPEVPVDRRRRCRRTYRRQRGHRRSCLIDVDEKRTMGQVKSKLRNAMCGGGGGGGDSDPGVAGSSRRRVRAAVVGSTGESGAGSGSEADCSDDDDATIDGRSGCDRTCCVARVVGIGGAGSRLQDSCGSRSLSGAIAAAELVVLGIGSSGGDCPVGGGLHGGVVTVAPGSGGGSQAFADSVELDTTVYTREVQILRHNYSFQQLQLQQHRVR